MSVQVTVFNTVGSNESVISFDGNTWSDLQGAFSNNSIVYKGMSAIIGESQVTLDQAGALTPTTDFTVFLLPVEVKSGNGNDAMFEDDDIDDGEFSDVFELPTVTSILSLENQIFIRQLDDAIAVLNVVKTSISNRVITDPHILEMQRKAAMLMANRQR